MSRTRRNPVVLALLVVLALTASLLLATPAEADKRSDKKSPSSADKPWSGFRIKDDGRAAGGYLGARRTRLNQVVYRIDPQAKSEKAKGFSTPAYATTLVGSGKKTVTEADTQQAAWIVGKYGSLRNKVQAAAVQVALDHLLVGGKYALTGGKTKARLKQLPRSKQKTVRSFALQMLSGASVFANTYSVTMVSTPSVSLGGSVGVSLRVANNANGVGIAKLPVTFTYPGAAPQSGVTDANGALTTSFTATAAGPQTVVANVQNVPENRLIVLSPTNKSASRVVVADVKTAGGATAITAVRAKPALVLTRSFGGVAAPYRTNGQTIALAGSYPTLRTATATLYGPYASDAAANCKGAAKVVGKGTVAMRNNQSYRLPTLTLPSAGYYRWAVTLPGDTYNDAPAAVCAGVMRRVD